MSFCHAVPTHLPARRPFRVVPAMGPRLDRARQVPAEIGMCRRDALEGVAHAHGDGNARAPTHRPRRALAGRRRRRDRQRERSHPVGPANARCRRAPSSPSGGTPPRRTQASSTRHRGERRWDLRSASCLRPAPSFDGAQDRVGRLQVRTTASRRQLGRLEVAQQGFRLLTLSYSTPRLGRDDSPQDVASPLPASRIVVARGSTRGRGRRREPLPPFRQTFQDAAPSFPAAREGLTRRVTM